MNVEKFTTARSLLEILTRTMNLINAEVENHHQRVAYLAYFIARAMELSAGEVELCVYAAILHDVGTVAWERPQSVAEVERHAGLVAAAGADLLSDLPDFNAVASIIAHCQDSWQEVEQCCGCLDEETRRLARISGIVYLADKVSMMLDEETPVLNQVGRIRAAVESGKGTLFCPVASSAFLEISRADFLWLDVRYNPDFLLVFTGDIRSLSLERTVGLTGLISRIIDFRSAFTAMHSAGVSASARRLAQLAGMSESECMMMEIAGNLHDIGKLKVPRAILEKPGRLTEEEFNIIREHPYYTRLILMGEAGFEKIADWAGFHHEKLNGRGYPFGFSASQLDTGSRIMAIADIFSAITEDRPYRPGMTRSQAMAVMSDNVRNGATCGELTALLSEHYEEIDAVRAMASQEAGRRYFDAMGKTG